MNLKAVQMHFVYLSQHFLFKRTECFNCLNVCVTQIKDTYLGQIQDKADDEDEEEKEGRTPPTSLVKPPIGSSTLPTCTLTPPTYALTPPTFALTPPTFVITTPSHI